MNTIDIQLPILDLAAEFQEMADAADAEEAASEWADKEARRVVEGRK